MYRYTGNEAVYTHTFEHEKKSDCPVCGSQAISREVDPTWTLHKFIESLKEDPNTYDVSPLLLTGEVRSKSLLCDPLPGPCTCSRFLSLRNQQDQIWIKRCTRCSQMGTRLLSRMRSCHLSFGLFCSLAKIVHCRRLDRGIRLSGD